jgi:hypothetical protein
VIGITPVERALGPAAASIRPPAAHFRFRLEPLLLDSVDMQFPGFPAAVRAAAIRAFGLIRLFLFQNGKSRPPKRLVTFIAGVQTGHPHVR